MIKATPKPLEELISYVKDYNKILVAGCDGCVTVCEAGGMKEAKILGWRCACIIPRRAKTMRW